MITENSFTYQQFLIGTSLSSNIVFIDKLYRELHSSINVFIRHEIFPGLILFYFVLGSWKII